MPKFMITTDIGGTVPSTEPMDFPNTEAAADDAQIALVDMARENLPNGKRADFGVKIEDEKGKEVYRAGLNFHAKTEDDIAREENEADVAAADIVKLVSKL